MDLHLAPQMCLLVVFLMHDS